MNESCLQILLARSSDSVFDRTPKAPVVSKKFTL